MNEKEAQHIIDVIEAFEDLSQFSLDQLLTLQKIVGYVIEEKQNDKIQRRGLNKRDIAKN